MARILQSTPKNLQRLAGVLSQGGIVAVPTETVYGLAGNALNPVAIAKIYEAKGRPARNPLIVHIGDFAQLEDICYLPEVGSKLIDHFWPGPLSLILKKKPVIPDSVTADLPTVAVRMPSHPVFHDLAKLCPFPLAAPSANPFGYLSPTRVDHVQSQMDHVLEWILDGGICKRGIESTILSLADPANPAVLRHGVISADELSTFLGQEVVQKNTSDEGDSTGLISAGLMKRHYSPKTKVQLFEGSPPESDKHVAIVFLGKPATEASNQFSLSAEGNLEEVAQNLYATLQQLDKQGYDIIHLEQPESLGTGVAIRDRMRRAAAE